MYAQDRRFEPGSDYYFAIFLPVFLAYSIRGVPSTQYDSFTY